MIQISLIISFIAKPYISDGDLTEAQLLKLSWRITTRDDLDKLAIVGLGIEDYVVGGHVSISESIPTAAHGVLKDWQKKQYNSRAAYSNLVAALQRLGWNDYITKLLQ